MNTEPALRAWRSLPLPYQAGLVVAVFAVMVLVGGSVGGLVTKWHDSRFDARELEREAVRQQDVAIRDAALRRAEAAEAQTAIVKEQLAALTQIATDRGKTAAQKQAAADEIARQGEASVAAVSDLPPDEAARDMHDRLVRLGLLKDAP